MSDLGRIESLLSRSGAGGGSLAIMYDPDESEDIRWSVWGVFGQEAPDSPMAGGAVHGIGQDLCTALEQALADAGL